MEFTRIIKNNPATYPEKGVDIFLRVDVPINLWNVAETSITSEDVCYRCNCPNQNCKKFIIVGSGRIMNEAYEVLNWKYAYDPLNTVRKVNKTCGLHEQ